MANSSNWSPEQERVFFLLQEGMRRMYADEDATIVLDWLHAQSGTVANTVDDVLRWNESFLYYDTVLEARATRSLLPPDQRKVFTFPWQTWAQKIDTPDEGMLILVAAPPGCGKTIVGEMIAEHNAKHGLRGALFNFELNKTVMLDRRAVRHIKYDRRALKQGLLSDQQLTALDEATPDWMDPADRQGLGDWRRLSRTLRQSLNAANANMLSWTGGVDYWSTPGWDIDRLCATVQGEHAANPLGFVVIDYFEKIMASARQRKLYGVNFNEREADTVEQLKILAEVLKMPILILSQLSKAGRAKSAEDMDGTEVRGSGAKTERSNINVLMTVEKPDEDADPLPAESVTLSVGLTKNTMGGTGSFKMFRNGARFTIADVQIESTDLNSGVKTTSLGG